MKRFLLLLLLGVAGLQLAMAQRTLIDKTVGIVGNKIILQSELEVQYQQYVSQLQNKVPEDTKCRLLDQMLQRQLLLTQAIKDSVEVSEDEVEARMDRNMQYYISMLGSEEKLEEYYGKSIIELKEEFRQDMREMMLADKMQSRIINDVKVTPTEVRTFFNNIPPDSLPFFNAEVEMGQIVMLPKISETQKKMAKEKIQALKDRIDQGEKFSTLAVIYSEDKGSADNNGELGFIKRGETVTEFEAVAFALKENEVSEVFETQFGYHILEVLEKRGEKVKIRHILIKPKITSFELRTVRDSLTLIRKQIVQDSLSFSEAVSRFSEDQATKNTGGMLVSQQTGNTLIEMGELDPEIYFVLDTMEVGQISAPVPMATEDGEQAYRLLYLKTMTEPHKANLKQDYSKIQAAALSDKQQKVMQEWVERRMKKTYVYIDPDYHHCAILDQWIKNQP